MVRVVSFLVVVLITPAFSFSQNSLISADELFQNLQHWKVLDLRSAEEFEEGHIFGAQHVSRAQHEDSTFDYGGMMPSQTQLENLLTKLNIEWTDQIVVYDSKGGCESARFWWIMDHYYRLVQKVQREVFILDGGYDSWGNRNTLISPWRTTTREKVPFKFNVEDPNAKIETDLLAKRDEIQFLFEDKYQLVHPSTTLLVDTRSLDEYIGKVMKDGAFRAGHIPGAIHFEWNNCVNYDGDKKIKSKEELQNLFTEKGITPDKKIICYCHSGVRSAHTTYVLSQILEYPDVSNYDGSWIEWSYFEELPIETGEVIAPAVDTLVVAEVQPGYWDTFKKSFGDFANYTWNEITFNVTPWYVNYFWWLIVLSLVVWLLEIAFPWRKNQPLLRNDFWMDAFFMFFNFYIFKIIIFMAFSNVSEMAFKDLFGGNLSKFALIDLKSMPGWAQLLIFFLVTDFIQWFTHVLLHRFNFLWQFHKVHHSVVQMGFAAHLRYHWMENVFYTPMKYIAVMLIGGFTPDQAFIVFYFAIAIGHLNHANIGLNYGPLKYILNSAKMHIWHHAYELPKKHSHGANFGITLSIWDYIFRTNYIPSDGRDIKLGFEGMEKFPKKFLGLTFYGFRKEK